MPFMDPEEHEEQEHLRRHLEEVRRMIAEDLDHLRRFHPNEWLDFARVLQRWGPYDRKERIQENAELRTAILESILAFFRKHMRTILEAEITAIERHFVTHGQELDEKLRKAKASEPPPSKVVEDFLRDIGMGRRRDPDVS